MQRLLVCLSAWIILSGTGWAQDPFIVESARKHITLSGYTRSRAKQTLAAEVNGKVLKVNYDVGQKVAEEPFLEIDPTFIDFQIELNQSALQKLKIGFFRAKSQKDFLQKEFKRIDRLRQGNVATVAKWEAAAEELNQAELALQTTDLEIKSLTIQLNELKERRRRHSLRALKGWVVVSRKVEPGEIIAAGTPLGQIADFTQMVIPLFVNGKQLDALQSEKKISVKVEGKPAYARLNWVNPEFDERTRKLAVELALIDYTDQIRGGLLTEFTLEVAAEGLMVPKASVTDRYNNPSVTVKKSGKRVPITILDESGDKVIIADNGSLEIGIGLQSR